MQNIFRGERNSEEGGGVKIVPLPSPLCCPTDGEKWGRNSIWGTKRKQRFKEEKNWP